MNAEQEIELLKGQGANLYGMLRSNQESEMAVLNCGPNVGKDVLSSDSPQSDSSITNINYNVSDTSGLAHLYSFESFPNADNTGIVMEPGDVVLGPMTWVHWAGITGASTTPAVSSTDTCVWLEVVITKGSEAATMKVGSRYAMEAALDSIEQETTEVVPLVETTWTNDLVTKVKKLQCGDAKISRGAG